MKVTIISDGTAGGTRVIDAAGAPIGIVQRVTWEVSSTAPLAKATIELANVPVTLVADNVQFVEVDPLAPTKKEGA